MESLRNRLARSWGGFWGGYGVYFGLSGQVMLGLDWVTLLWVLAQLHGGKQAGLEQISE